LLVLFLAGPSPTFYLSKRSDASASTCVGSISGNS
jgi:hypothetical protein